MKAKLRVLYFWLANLYFERLWKKPSAQAIGIKIAAEVEKNNDSKYARSHCRHCNGTNLVGKITGSDGDGLFYFQSAHHSYKCSDCGHEQDDSGSNYKFVRRELKPLQIKEDGCGTYRYVFFPKGIGETIFQSILKVWFLSLACFIIFMFLAMFKMNPYFK